jgi:hypothetical protein
VELIRQGRRIRALRDERTSTSLPGAHQSQEGADADIADFKMYKNVYRDNGQSIVHIRSLYSPLGWTKVRGRSGPGLSPAGHLLGDANDSGSYMRCMYVQLKLRGTQVDR